MRRRLSLNIEQHLGDQPETFKTRARLKKKWLICYNHKSRDNMYHYTKWEKNIPQPVKCLDKKLRDLSKLCGKWNWQGLSWKSILIPIVFTIETRAEAGRARKRIRGTGAFAIRAQASILGKNLAKVAIKTVVELKSFFFFSFFQSRKILK